MFYGDVMWGMADLKSNVPSAIQRLLNHGVDKKQIVVTVTHAGLTDESLNFMIDQVLSFDVHGLYVWEFPLLSKEHLNIIKERLGIVGIHGK